MMAKQRFYIPIILFLFSLLSCENTGTIELKTIPLGPFTLLNLHDNIDVFLVQDSTNRVTIEANEDIIDNISCQLENDTLIIKNELSHGWTKGYNYKINATLYFTDMVRILYQGSGDVTNFDTLKLETFWIGTMKGSGTFNLTIDADHFRLSSSTGTSDYFLHGTSEILTISNDAVGLINSVNLKTQDVIIRHNGTNNIFIKPENKLNAKITYIGDLFYYGNPGIIDTTIEGSGKIYKLSQ